MKDLNQLAEIVKTYYENQVAKGKAMCDPESSFPTVAIASLPKFLLDQGVNWKEFGVDSFNGLLRMIPGIRTLRLTLANGKHGEPRFYVDNEPCTETNIQQKNLDANSAVHDDKMHEPQPYEVRVAYRKLLGNNTSTWVPIKDLMSEVVWTSDPKSFTKKYKLQYNWQQKAVRISNISKYEIVDDIYFDPKRNSYKKAIKSLRSLALKEEWDDNGRENKLLDNYLCYSYARLKECNGINKSEDGLHACWNTGLVDVRYMPIYCYMQRRSTTDRWVFQGFCIAGEDLGKSMVSKISPMPERPYYFENDSLLYNPDMKTLFVDYDHIICEHPSRLPEEWLTKVLEPDQVKWQKDESASEYDNRIGEIISKNDTALLLLQQLIKQAVEISVTRCQWNYKTAIPYYDPSAKKIGWFLPLCQRVKSTDENSVQVPFAALVVTKEASGQYQGQTIYRLSWAYRCARLVCRPDSDWLTPLFKLDEKLDEE